MPRPGGPFCRSKLREERGQGWHGAGGTGTSGHGCGGTARGMLPGLLGSPCHRPVQPSTPRLGGPASSFTPVLRTGTTQCMRTPSAPCQHSGVCDWGHRLAKAGCAISPRWDRTPCPEAPGSRGARKGQLLPVPSPPLPVPSTMVPDCPNSSKAPKPPSTLARGAVSHGAGDSVPATAQSQGTSKDRSRWGSQALALGDTLVAAWGHPNQSHCQPCGSVGTWDRDGDPAVSPWWLWPPHPPPAPLAPGSWERLRAGTRRGPPCACPLLQPPPPQGRGRATPEHWVNWETAGATGATPSPSRRRELGTYPMQECLRDGHRLPGSISLLRQCHRQPRSPRRGRPQQRQHRPGTASCRPAAPCFPASASRPRWYRGHKAALWLRRPRG